ncbi:hypothetical protein GCM10007304_46170 [Rhodococcoides trifolii]|uniref:Phosphomevalonate dehydratase large subunit-like domain-containing protein n=2 Tax=Rhodococcoides trifolii TaxID=908250 RepID=A0A917G823_9NOCA|nr:hypothetical protein GCM10007304_46170 [Rhodococcus trifolii]
MLDGDSGEAMSKVMKTLVRYGELFGARRLVPLDGPTHVVTSMGMAGLEAAFDLLDTLIAAGARTVEPFTVDPRPYDFDAVPYTDAEMRDIRALYPHQDRYEAQLRALGLKDEDAFSCTAYLPETGNTPGEGDILSWAESSAVVFANSVLGARTNRNSGLIELMGAIAGRAPEFGLLLDSGRLATWQIDVRTTVLPPATVLGSEIGRRVVEGVPYITGLDRFLTDLPPAAARDYLKDFGAATASSGAVGLFHIDKVTPEAIRLGTTLLAGGFASAVIDDDTIVPTAGSERVSEPRRNTEPETALIGCPHLSREQLSMVVDSIVGSLEDNGKSHVSIRTILSTAPHAVRAFRSEHPGKYERAIAAGITISTFCPALHMNCPSSAGAPVITNSTKLRTYTTSRFFRDDVVLHRIVHGNGQAMESANGATS